MTEDRINQAVGKEWRCRQGGGRDGHTGGAKVNSSRVVGRTIKKRHRSVSIAWRAKKKARWSCNMRSSWRRDRRRWRSMRKPGERNAESRREDARK